MTIEVEAQTVVARAPAEVFAATATATENLAKYFKGNPPLIPAIVEATIDGGGPPREGALRTVKLSDGSVIKERILAFESPARHAYDMAEMNALQRLICTNMVSEWRYTPEGAGTRIVWHYTIHPRPFRGLIAKLVARSFRGAMQRCLDAIAAGG